jgi:hypothetical protein
MAALAEENASAKAARLSSFVDFIVYAWGYWLGVVLAMKILIVGLIEGWLRAG